MSDQAAPQPILDMDNSNITSEAVNSVPATEADISMTDAPVAVRFAAAFKPNPQPPLR
jgi:hypothetical protein